MDNKFFYGVILLDIIVWVVYKLFSNIFIEYISGTLGLHITFAIFVLTWFRFCLASKKEKENFTLKELKKGLLKKILMLPCIFMFMVLLVVFYKKFLPVTTFFFVTLTVCLAWLSLYLLFMEIGCSCSLEYENSRFYAKVLELCVRINTLVFSVPVVMWILKDLVSWPIGQNPISLKLYGVFLFPILLYWQIIYNTFYLWQIAREGLLEIGNFIQIQMYQNGTIYKGTVSDISLVGLKLKNGETGTIHLIRLNKLSNSAIYNLTSNSNCPKW